MRSFYKEIVYSTFCVILGTIYTFILFYKYIFTDLKLILQWDYTFICTLTPPYCYIILNSYINTLIDLMMFGMQFFANFET